MQSALAKERREQKHAVRAAEMDCIPTGLHKNWIDPMPDCKNLERLRFRARDKRARMKESRVFVGGVKMRKLQRRRRRRPARALTLLARLQMAISFPGSRHNGTSRAGGRFLPSLVTTSDSWAQPELELTGKLVIDAAHLDEI